MALWSRMFSEAISRTLRRNVPYEFPKIVEYSTVIRLHERKERRTLFAYTVPDHGIVDKRSAKHFVANLMPHERTLLYEVLRKKRVDQYYSQEQKETAEVTHDDLVAIWWINHIPFVAYGFLDNLVMIVAGGVFDKAIGLYMGISIMAAAGVGNIVSNIMGLGMFHYVETAVSYFGIKPPRLNAKQMNNKSVRVFTNLARYLGLFVGCFLGMTPLLFIDSPERSIPVDYNAADDEDQEMEMREIATTTSTMRYDLDDIGKRKDEEMARKRSEFMRAEYARFHAEWKRLTSKEDAEDIGMFMHLSDMSDDSS